MMPLIMQARDVNPWQIGAKALCGRTLRRCAARIHFLRKCGIMNCTEHGEMVNCGTALIPAQGDCPGTSGTIVGLGTSSQQ